MLVATWYIKSEDLFAFQECLTFTYYSSFLSQTEVQYILSLKGYCCCYCCLKYTLKHMSNRHLRLTRLLIQCKVLTSVKFSLICGKLHCHITQSRQISFAEHLTVRYQFFTHILWGSSYLTFLVFFPAFLSFQEVIV